MNFPKKEQITFMKGIKRGSNLTWKVIAQSIGISKSMVFFYLNGKSKISKENYEKLCKIANVEPNCHDYIIIKNKTQEIKIPNGLDENLAEFLGLLAGDGYVSNVNYEVSITCHKILDKDYINNKVSRLFFDLFSMNVIIKEEKNNNVIRCLVHSKILSEYLTSNFQVPSGKKKGKLHIPGLVKPKKELLISYIRGLFDTDGSVYLRRKSGLVISIISRDSVFLDEVKDALNGLDYSPSISGKNLYIYRQEQVKRFMVEISPSNRKHLQRYDNFIKESQVNKNVAPVV